MEQSLRNATRDRIRRVFIEALHLNLQADELDYAHKLDECAGLDSVAVLEFIVALEKEFEVRIELEKMRFAVIRDLPQLADYIEERSLRRGGAAQ